MGPRINPLSVASMTGSNAASNTTPVVNNDAPPFKDFNQVTSFVSSIGIAFSLNSAITITGSNTARSRELYGFASVAFVASLALSTACSLIVTSKKVYEQPEERNVVKILGLFSYASLFCVGGAFLTIGVALIESVGRGVGIAFISVIGAISLLGIIAYFIL